MSQTGEDSSKTIKGKAQGEITSSVGVATEEVRKRALAKEYLEVVAGHVPSDAESGTSHLVVSTGTVEVLGTDVDGKRESAEVQVFSGAAGAAETARSSVIVEDTDFELIQSGNGESVKTTQDETSVIIMGKKPVKGKGVDESKSPKGKKKKQKRRPKQLSAGSTGDSGYSEGSMSDLSPPSSTSSSRFSLWSSSTTTSTTVSSESGIDSEDAFGSTASVGSLEVLPEETIKESGAELSVDSGDVFLIASAASTGSSLEVLPEETIKETGDVEIYEYALSGADDEPAVMIAPVPLDDSTLRSRLEVLRDTTGVLSRACRCALPLQALMVLLLGVACLLPMTEEEFSCALANNFHSSLALMLKYTDGPPPT